MRKSVSINIDLSGGKLVKLLLPLLSLFVLAGLGVAACRSDGTQASDRLRTRSLEIVDSQGVVRMVLTTVEGGRPSVSLLDDAGNIRGNLFLGDNGAASLVLSDRPRIALLDKDSKVRLVEYLDEAGSPVLAEIDGQGTIRTVVNLDATGKATIGLFDGGGKSVWTAP